MRPRHPIAILTVLCLLLGFNSGCLSLSMLNREMPETKSRLDSLESRVSALEMANSPQIQESVVVPGAHSRAAPATATR